MALRIRDPCVEKLVTALVELTGETETDVVKKALHERLAKLQRKQERRSLAAELNEIALHCASLPVFDDRSADEMLGYDERGLPV